MNETPPNFDLEKRCISFAKEINILLRSLHLLPQNIEYGKQLIRSSGSVGANYIEANNAIGYKDFLLRMRIARKEAKESQYWLALLEVPAKSESKHRELANESNQIIKILSAIINKVEHKSSGAANQKTV